MVGLLTNNVLTGILRKKKAPGRFKVENKNKGKEPKVRS